MANEKLREALLERSENYDVSRDEVLAPLAYRAAYSAKEFRAICVWTFSDRPDFDELMVRIDANPHNFTVDTTARALSCLDELGALLILQQEDAVDEFAASAILATARPQVFAYMDDTSIDALNELGALEKSSLGSVDALRWIPFLRAARQLANETDLSLLTVSRALRTK